MKNKYVTIFFGWEFFIYFDFVTIINLILIFCSTGLCTRMLFNLLPNFIIVHRIVSQKKDLFRSFNICSDAKERVGCGKQREAIAPIQSW